MPATPIVLAALLCVGTPDPAASGPAASDLATPEPGTPEPAAPQPGTPEPTAPQPASEPAAPTQAPTQAQAPTKEAKISERLQDPQARRHYEVANKHFADRRYGLAAQELAFAYRIEQLPELLLQRAMILDADGRCDEGIPLLQEFLATQPSANRADRARYMIDDCRKRRGIRAPPSAAETSQPTRHTAHPDGQASDAEPTSADVTRGGDDETQPRPPKPSERPWHRDPAGGVLLGLGGAALISGGGLLIAATQRQKTADASALHSDYDAAHGRAVLLQSIAGGALVAGAALTVGALLRYHSLRQGPAAARAPTPSAWLGPRGGGVSLRGRF